MLSLASRTLTGAWIETASMKGKVKGRFGRTLTGAWIETTPHWKAMPRVWSHPHGCVD